MSYSPTYSKRYRLDVAQGIARGYVPTAPVKARLEELCAAGMTKRGIAVVAGVSPSTVCRILAGEYATARRDAVGRLMRVTPAGVLARHDPDGFVPDVGTRRRIRALLALGWRHQDIAAHMTTAHRSAVILHHAGPYVTRRTAQSVQAAYDALSMRPGPSAQTRARAARLGYAPPLAWDDDTIDDPAATPPHTPAGTDDDVDPVAVDRALAGDHLPLTYAERLEVIRAMVDRGHTDAQIADRLGVVTETVLRNRHTHNIATSWKAA